MGRIIALQGRADSGKSTTIALLPAILLANGYNSVVGSRQNYGGDFLEIFDNGKQKVGVTSSGDTFDLVHDRLTDLINASCDVCICACWTYDRVPPGTVAATNSFLPSYTTQYYPKTITSISAQPMANTTDANALYGLI